MAGPDPRRRAPRAAMTTVEVQGIGMPAAWECGDCGWTMRQDQLPSGVRLHDVSNDHGDLYCSRPPAWLGS